MRRAVKLLSAVLGLAFIGSLTAWQFSSATYTFNQNRIIDDSVFDYANSMTAAQIDSFLNQFPSSCISTNSGFSAPDVTGYQPSPSAFFYSSTPVSAGTVIYDAAQAYGLNPQVLIATLQKEEGLIDGSGPYGCGATAMASALGYGCTDSGTNSHDYSYPGGGLVTPLYYRNGTPSNSITGSCVNSGPKAGFSEQIIHATWLLKFSEQRSEGNINWAVVKGNWDNSDDPQSCYSGYMTQGTWQRCPSGGASYYDGWATIDSTAVHMDTGATAALYVYTPHFHGNQLFFDNFTNWFGSTMYSYAASVTVSTYSDAARTQPLSLASSVTSGQKIYITVSAENTGNKTWSNAWTRVGTTNPTDRSSVFQDSSWLWNNRAAALVESSVAPGQTGTFKFSLTAPNVDGVYHESFGLIADGQADGWMKDSADFTLDITVSNPFNGIVTGLSTYRDSGRTLPTDTHEMASGETAYLLLKVKNTGNQTWSNSWTRVATTNPNDRTSAFSDGSWLSSNRPATLQETSVAPGQTGTFKFSITAPGTVGSYNESFGLVADGQSGGWMPEPGFSLGIKTIAPPKNVLYSDTKLYPGQTLTSKNGTYTFTVQSDGNLVIYTALGPIWGSRTNGRSIGYVTMQGDGNLVIYDPNNQPFWGTNTAGRGPSSLVMQDDGNLVIYTAGGQPTWGSGTEHNIANTPSSLADGQQLQRGDMLLSPNGAYRLIMQSDGNLVIYSPNRALWGSGTSGTGGNHVVMQSDGNLVIYAGSQPLWGTSTNGRGTSTLRMQSDGNLVIYDASNHPTWGSGTDGQL